MGSTNSMFIIVTVNIFGFSILNMGMSSNGN